MKSLPEFANRQLAWVSAVDPKLLVNPTDRQMIAKLFGDVENQTRSQQKQIGRDAIQAILAKRK